MRPVACLSPLPSARAAQSNLKHALLLPYLPCQTASARAMPSSRSSASQRGAVPSAPRSARSRFSTRSDEGQSQSSHQGEGLCGGLLGLALRDDLGSERCAAGGEIRVRVRIRVTSARSAARLVARLCSCDRVSSWWACPSCNAQPPYLGSISRELAKVEGRGLIKQRVDEVVPEGVSGGGGDGGRGYRRGGGRRGVLGRGVEVDDEVRAARSSTTEMRSDRRLMARATSALAFLAWRAARQRRACHGGRVGLECRMSVSVSVRDRAGGEGSEGEGGARAGPCSAISTGAVGGSGGSSDGGRAQGRWMC